MGLPSAAWRGFPSFNGSGGVCSDLGPSDNGKSKNDDDDGSPCPRSTVLDARRAYLSTVSHASAELGRVLRKLTKSGLSKSTVVALTGDSGLLLGEHGAWGVGTAFEEASSVPFVVAVPGLTDRRPLRSRLPVRAGADLLPTLAEAAGLDPVKECPREEADEEELCTDGRSVMPVIKRKIKDREQWRKEIFNTVLHWKDGKEIMGYSIRTKEFR